MTNNIKVENSSKTFFEKVKYGLSYFYDNFIKYPAYILTHPIKGFDYFKRENEGKMNVAVTFLIAMIILQILKFQYTGFVVSQNDPNDLNTIREVSLVVFPVILFTAANWSITTLFDGKGKMRDIFMMICYSLYPMLWTESIGLIFSNFITAEEVGFYLLLIGIGNFLTGYLIFFGLLSIHEYGVLKCIGSIVGTALAILVILFVMLLAFDLFQQIYSFIYTIYREISLRYL